MDKINKKNRSLRDVGVQQVVDGQCLTEIKAVDPIKQIIFVTSMLSLFSEPQVREDIKNGHFTLPVGLCLKEMDLLCNKLLPRWYGRPFNKGIAMAQVYMKQFIGGYGQQVVIKMGDGFSQRTCDDWLKLLEQVAANNYWNEREPANTSAQLPNVPPAKPKSTETNKILIACDNESTNTDSSAKLTTGTVNNNTEKRDVPVFKIGLLTCVPSAKSKISSSNDNCEAESVKELVSKANDASTLRPAPLKNKECCNHCGIPGHAVNSCWRRLKLCLICGQNHHMEQCPKFTKTPRSLLNVRCPLCDGNHVGRLCPSRKHEQTFCSWCGKVGHDYEQCYWRLGRCLVCGDSNHKVKDCSKSNVYKPLLFPPWCGDCGSNHLGSDCESPYME